MAGNSSQPSNFKDKAENTGANLGAAAGRKVGEGVARTQEAASSATQKVQDVASTIGHKAQEAASSAAHKAQEMASNVGEKAEDALSSVGDRMSSLAGALREKAPQSGMLGTAASSVAEQLEAGGHYLQEHGFKDMAQDLTAVIRRYPIQAICVALGVGFLVGMGSRR